MFPEFDFARTERDSLKAKAIRLKTEIQASEAALRDQAQHGESLCETTTARLERLRREQYELAQKL